MPQTVLVHSANLGPKNRVLQIGHGFITARYGITMSHRAMARPAIWSSPRRSFSMVEILLRRLFSPAPPCRAVAAGGTLPIPPNKSHPDSRFVAGARRSW
jgi:hypothetical protein